MDFDMFWLSFLVILLIFSFIVFIGNIIKCVLYKKVDDIDKLFLMFLLKRKYEKIISN